MLSVKVTHFLLKTILNSDLFVTNSELNMYDVQNPASKLVYNNLPFQLQRMPPQTVANLMGFAQFKELSANEAIFSTSAETAQVMYISSGLLVVKVRGIDQVVRINSFLKENYLFSTKTIPRNVVSFQLKALRTTRLISWQDSTFNEILARCPEMVHWFVPRLQVQVEALHLTRLQLMRLNGPAQLAYLMWGLSTKGKTPAEPRLFDIRLNQAMLADYLGVSREEISRRKVRLVQAGYLERVEGGHVLLPSITGLFSV